MDDKINKLLHEPSARGRKLRPTTTRSAIWEFWHANSIPSTITSPVLLRVTEESKIQVGLDYIDTKAIISKGNWNFC